MIEGNKIPYYTIVGDDGTTVNNSCQLKANKNRVLHIVENVTAYYSVPLFFVGKICDIKSAPKVPNIEVTRWTKKWPQQGIIRCRSDATWRGNTPPRATCVGDIWTVNGQCLPRFIYNAVPVGKLENLLISF